MVLYTQTSIPRWYTRRKAGRDHRDQGRTLQFCVHSTPPGCYRVLMEANQQIYAKVGTESEEGMGSQIWKRTQARPDIFKRNLQLDSPPPLVRERCYSCCISYLIKNSLESELQMYEKWSENVLIFKNPYSIWRIPLC